MGFGNFKYQFQSAAERSKRYSERHFRLLGYLACILIPATTIVERAVADPTFDTLYIRILAGIVGLLVLFHDRLPEALRSRFEFVWIFAATLILPFSYGAILTLNAVHTPVGSDLSPIWVYQYIVAVFIFVQLMNSGLLSCALWTASSFLLVLACLAISEPNTEALKQAWLFPLPVYVTALVIGSITNRNVYVVQSEQFRAASAIGSNIAHELRTPLASIRSFARAVGRFLPLLVDGYKKAQSAGLQVEPLPSNHLKELRASAETIQSEVEYSNTIIDMLLMNTSANQTHGYRSDNFPISEPIREAISRFPFNNSQERELIRCNLESDFNVRGSRPLLVHVFFNLLKNGLFYVQGKPDGELTIVSEVSGSLHSVTVTDTGPGIPDAIRSQVFDRFFSTGDSHQGAGIGLSFCKMVMESIGGEIYCDSREGEYTTFRLVFPVADKSSGQSLES